MTRQFDSPEVTVSLHGTIETFPLTDVLALLSSTKKTGELRVEGERGEGRLWFVDGSLVGQRVGPARDFVDAVFELLRLKTGQFDFDADKSASEPSEPSAIEPVLTEAQERLEEWQGIEALIPSLQHGIRLASESPGPTITLRDDQWRLVVAIAGGRTVGAIVEHLDSGEFATCRALHELVAENLAVVEAPVAPAPKAAPAKAAAPAPAPRPEPAPAAAKPETKPFEPAAAPAANEPSLESPPPLKPRPRPSLADALGDVASSLPPTEPAKAAGPAGGLASQLRAVQGDDAVATPAPKAEAAAGGLSSKLVPPATDDAPAAPAARTAPEAAKPAPKPEPAATAKAGDDGAADPQGADADAAPAASEGPDEAINRGLLLKFLSSVRS